MPSNQGHINKQAERLKHCLCAKKLTQCSFYQSSLLWTNGLPSPLLLLIPIHPIATIVFFPLCVQNVIERLLKSIPLSHNLRLRTQQEGSSSSSNEQISQHMVFLCFHVMLYNIISFIHNTHISIFC